MFVLRVPHTQGVVGINACKATVYGRVEPFVRLDSASAVQVFEDGTCLAVVQLLFTHRLHVSGPGRHARLGLMAQ